MAHPQQPHLPSATHSQPSGGSGVPSGPKSSRSSREHQAAGGQSIPIQDFNLLKRIGSGAYGEVWLAQSITGALRAVKIVWREDFEFEKTFHREFEGIQKFEPISRGHPGLVNVLHVGWNEFDGFYYYVMELGDDAFNADQIDIQTYVPRTLSSDFKNFGRLNLDFCRQTGIYMAEALSYMHSHGLTHRDIKPANIIFVKGVCKLADIGLVAAHGERSFVGTEGFVPPEGPGTFAADIFSLGKVLYEISSGKDRMEFPEVPDDLSFEELKAWREWNEVICKACAPNLKERFASAVEFAEALRNVGVPKPESKLKIFTRNFKRLVLGSFLLGFVLVVVKNELSWSYSIPAPEKKILTEADLALAKLPAVNTIWLNSLNQRFVWKNKRHEAVSPVSLATFNTFLEDSGRSFEGEIVSIDASDSKILYSVLVPKADADPFCRWLTEQDRKEGSLNGDFEYRWMPDPSIKRESNLKTNWTSLRLFVVPLQFGQVKITSEPPHAEVVLRGQSLGHTPLDLSKVRVGKQSFTLALPGYKAEVVEGTVQDGKELHLQKKLNRSNIVSFGSFWANSLKMGFVPLGEVLMAETEITQEMYFRFRRQMPTTDVLPADFVFGANLPMTHISKQDAVNFCKWLTLQERKSGFLETIHSYRLPTDDEWSMAANLPRERGLSPAERHQRIEGIYPWGFTWPPTMDPPIGNFADQKAFQEKLVKKAIPNYNDGFTSLAPAGSFPANVFGLKDLGGNTWEWVQDQFGGSDAKLQKLGVTRGGAWNSFERAEFLSSYRRATGASARSNDTSFRLVLSRSGITARADSDSER